MKKNIQRGKLVRTYQGKIFTMYEQEIIFPNGEKKIYEYCERPASVSVLAFDVKGRLLLIRERRVGYKHNVWFLPGGRVDKQGESPRRSAIRELQEEAGFAARSLEFITELSLSPGYMSQRIQVVLARDLYPSRLAGDEPEPMRVETVNLRNLLGLLEHPQFTEGRALAAMYVVRDVLQQRGELTL